MNNAGYANSAAIEDIPEEDFRAQIETNLFGVVNVTKAALPVLRRQGSGHFLQFSSIGGRAGRITGPERLSDREVRGRRLLRSPQRRRLGPLGIKVTIIEPGGFRTDWGGSSMTALP